MIHLQVKQGSNEWLAARLAIPTASNFHRILTPETRKPSSQAKAYMHELLAEWVIGVPHESGVSGFMDRGTRMEPEARKWYAYERGVEVSECGIFLRDDKMAGASPDGTVDADGLLEIKVPNATTHVANLLYGLDGYRCQVQGQLWLSERQWCDRISYHPEMPPIVQRYERDEEFIEALAEEVDGFVKRLLAARDTLLALGCQPAGRVMIPASMVTDATPF